MRQILVEFDGSVRSRRIVRYAAEVAVRSGARLHVLWVVRWPLPGLDIALDDGHLDQAEADASAQLRGLQRECEWLQP